MLIFHELKDFFIIAQSLFHFTVYETAANSITADGQHVKLSPDDFADGICFQLALDVVPHLLLRIELCNVALGVVEAFDDESVADAGSGWHFDRLELVVAKKYWELAYRSDLIKRVKLT